MAVVDRLHYVRHDQEDRSWQPPPGEIWVSVLADFDGNKTLERSILQRIRRSDQIRVRCDGLERHEGRLSVVDLPSGQSIPFTCQLTFNFAEKSDESGDAEARYQEAATSLAKACLAERRPALGEVLNRTLSRALDEFRDAHEGRAFALFERDESAAVSKKVEKALQGIGLTAVHVALTPRDTSSHDQLDFDERVPGIDVVLTAGLQEVRVGYKARLLPVPVGDVNYQARIAYGGRHLGKEERPMPDAPVPGQLDSIQAWLPKLLQQALSQASPAKLAANDPALLKDVMSEVNSRLTVGTGYQLSVLHLFPAKGDVLGFDFQEPLLFEESYNVAGASQGRRLKVQHSVKYRWLNRDVWRSHAETRTEKEVLQGIVIKQMKNLLHDKHLHSIIQMHVTQRQGILDAPLSEKLDEAVRKEANAAGLDVEPIHILIDIPEGEFIGGRAVKVPTHSYRLADPVLAPTLELSMTLQVGESQECRKVFADKVVRGSGLEGQVLETIMESVRADLRNTSPRDYYSSPMANCIASSADKTDRTLAVAKPVVEFTIDPLKMRIEATISAAMEEHFGLRVTNLFIRPSNDDVVNLRISELRRRTLKVEAVFGTGHWFKGARGLLRVLGLNQDEHMDTFLVNTQRYKSLSEYEGLIIGQASDTFKSMGQLLAHLGPEAYQMVPHIREQAFLHIVRRVREDCGIDIEVVELELIHDALEDLSALVNRIDAAKVQLTKLAQLHDELELASFTRETTLDFLGSETPEDKITRIERSIAKTEEKLETLQKQYAEKLRQQTNVLVIQGPTALPGAAGLGSTGASASQPQEPRAWP